ncbi:g3657 [Coccomyxa viridis]|uniref:G3657 protein n=1 Tax=Coccomyxa viridis TaxID=1274662 RepID=A0ABP1FNB5_9CHLO
MASNACSQPCHSHHPIQTPHIDPSAQVRASDSPAHSEACNVSFNVWVKPSRESDEEDTASSSSSTKSTTDDLLRCNEEIEDDSVSISSKRPTPGLCPWERPAKRMRTAASPAVKDASPLPRWDILTLTTPLCV